VSHASFVVQPPVLTYSPPQPSSAANVDHQYTHDPSIASPLPHTKPGDHAYVTTCVMESLIKLIKLQFSPDARLNQDTKV
jgi:hypothetical protein